jgi:hypothetical protein
MDHKHPYQGWKQVEWHAVIRQPKFTLPIRTANLVEMGVMDEAVTVLVTVFPDIVTLTVLADALTVTVRVMVLCVCVVVFCASAHMAKTRRRRTKRFISQNFGGICCTCWWPEARCKTGNPRMPLQLPSYHIDPITTEYSAWLF